MTLSSIEKLAKNGLDIFLFNQRKLIFQGQVKKTPNNPGVKKQNITYMPHEF